MKSYARIGGLGFELREKIDVYQRVAHRSDPFDELNRGVNLDGAVSDECEVEVEKKKRT
jgi:hypothetical protein